ncbi:MAG: CaiB/BaiF CoA-transferase family protein [Myxococcales bacterium]|nr:CoA transferase [Myxococcota bacterium]MDW8280403.1 CaiB/BaiF CoA-transferase family protein [Myxococcales bacterium]
MEPDVLPRPPEPPLRDVRVLDLSRLLPGPFCTLILADLGAQVDKVEDPHVGDYLRLFPPHRNGLGGRFCALNRSKRSLCLDLKQPAGREALLRLLPRYQVLVEGFRPGVLDRLGLGPKDLLARHPSLVICSLSGYGQDGPYRDRAGHDINYLALSGVLGLSGADPKDPPHPLPVQLADVGGGALWAAVGILAALLAARRTGCGRHLDVSLCEGALSFLLPDFGQLDAGAPDPVRGQELLTGGAACYGVYRTACGRYLAVGALEPKFWLAFNRALGRAADPAELLAPPAEQARIRQEIQAILGQRSRDEWEQVFAEVDACVEPVLSLQEVRQHPLHQARGLFFSTGGPDPVPQVRTPLTPRDPTATPPPRLGEHSEQILAEGGFSPAEIEALRQSGVVR